MKYKLKRIVELSRNLSQLGGLKGKKFTIYYAKAMAALSKVFDEIQERLNEIRRDPTFQEYIVAEQELAKGYAKTDEAGNIIADEQLPPEKNEEIKAKLEELRSDPKWSDIVAEFKTEIEKLGERVETEEVELDLPKIKYYLLPKDITANQVFGINELIADVPDGIYMNDVFESAEDDETDETETLESAAKREAAYTDPQFSVVDPTTNCCGDDCCTDNICEDK
jgi:hypothetical protein